MLKSFRFLISLILIIFSSFTVNCQFNVKGIVIDQNEEPIPFANVIFSGTKLGTLTNFKGEFELSSSSRKKELTVQLLGYETKKLKLNKKNLFLKITLFEGEQLNEVIVVEKPKKRLKKKQNPAYRVLKEVWARKSNMGFSKPKAYAYEKYSTFEVGLNNMDTLFLKKILGESLDSVLTIIRQNRNNKLFYIPLNLKEEHRSVYGENNLSIERSDLNAIRISGLKTNGFFFKRIENVFKYVNVLNETVVVADKSFSSPIAETGFINYDYVLTDSLKSKKGKEYKIYFFPRRDGDWVFEGNMTISAPSYALKEIEMRISPDINLNIVRDVYIKQNFQEIESGIFLPYSSNYEGDFTVFSKNEDEKGLYVKKNETFNSYVLNQPKTEMFYKESQSIRTDLDLNKDDDYWTNLDREETTTNIIMLLKDLEDNRKVKSITSTIDFLTSGYKVISPDLQFGKWWDALNYNDVEGLRFNARFRTFRSLDDRFRSTAFIAYGLKDKEIKYGIDSRYLLSYKPRLTLGLVYSNDYEQLGNSIFSTGILLDSKPKVKQNLFSRGSNYFLSEVETIGFTTLLEPFKNLKIGLSLESKHFASADQTYFNIDYEQNGTVLTQYNNTSFSTYLTFTPNRNVYGRGVDQKLGRSNFASFSLKYTRGLDGILQGNFSYNQLQFSYKHPIRISFFGILESNLELGKTFDPVPIALLTALPANQGYSLIPRTFSLINYYDWISDNYLLGHFEHHFNGFIMNKIPLLEKLKLRSLVTFRFAYGSISNDNISKNKSKIVYNSPSNKPYYEYSLGIENIGFGNFKFFRADFIWRSDLHDTFLTNSPKNGVPKFGIRLGAKPNF
tara:strand:- start:13263 stop:15791 length:2529 start_codon:yes stop_codon:yes gene_type:complete